MHGPSCHNPKHPSFGSTNKEIAEQHSLLSFVSLKVFFCNIINHRSSFLCTTTHFLQLPTTTPFFSLLSLLSFEQSFFKQASSTISSNCTVSTETLLAALQYIMDHLNGTEIPSTFKAFSTPHSICKPQTNIHFPFHSVVNNAFVQMQTMSSSHAESKKELSMTRTTSTITGILCVVLPRLPPLALSRGR